MKKLILFLLLCIGQASYADYYINTGYIDGYQPNTFTYSESGLVSTTSSYLTYEDNTVVTFTAAAVTVEADFDNNIVPQAYTFKGWKDASGEIISTEASYTFTITENTTLQPVFEDEVVDISISGSNFTISNESISDDNQVSYTEEGLLGYYNSQLYYSTGSEVTLTTTPIAIEADFDNDIVPHDYIFKGWTNSYNWINNNGSPQLVYGTIISTDNPYTFTATETTTLIPVFEDKIRAIRINNNDIFLSKNGNICYNYIGQNSGHKIYDYYYHTEFVNSITITCRNILDFEAWVDAEGNILSTDNSYTFSINDDVPVCKYINDESIAYSLSVPHPNLFFLANETDNSLSYLISNVDATGYSRKYISLYYNPTQGLIHKKGFNTEEFNSADGSTQYVVVNDIININNDNIVEYVGASQIVYTDGNGTINDIINPYGSGIIDFNGDGLKDILTNQAFFTSQLNTSNNPLPWVILQQQRNGEWVNIPAESFDYDTYNNIHSDDWESTTSSGGTSSGTSIGFLPGLGSSSSVGTTTPTTNDLSASNAISYDFNNDGLDDILCGGFLFTNVGNNQYIEQYVGGDICSFKDLNGDLLPDLLIYTGSAIKTVIVEADGTVLTETLWENDEIDSKVYTYDLDQDNDLDILLTCSSTNFAGTFVAICENDGSGNFTKHEQYLTQNLIITGSKDLNNDGYYDLIAVSIAPRETGSYTNPGNLYVITGNSDFSFTFQDNALLYDLPTDGSYYWYEGISNYIYAEDIDLDGKYEMWHTEYDCDSIIQLEATAINNKPEKLSAPEVAYLPAQDQVEIHWATGTDDISAPLDLSYALRIGTESGKGDLVYAYATSTGVRKNLKDGNVGFVTSKKYNVSNWPAGTLYVSVQAIDPMHQGSEWSDEVIFTKGLDVDFSILKTEIDIINNDNEVLFTANKAVEQASVTDTICLHYNGIDNTDFTMDWDIADGQIITNEEDNENLYVRFDTPGKKYITLSITYNGQTYQEQKMFTVLATGFTYQPYYYTDYAGTNDNLSTLNYSYNNSNFGKYLKNIHYYADFDYDGDIDIISDKININDGEGGFSMLGKMFNISLSLSDGMWLDKDLDGDLDIVSIDNSIELINNTNSDFSQTNSSEDYIDMSNNRLDINNDGYLDALCIEDAYGVTNAVKLNSGDYLDANAVELDDDTHPWPTNYNSWYGYRYLEPNYFKDWNRDGYIDVIFDTQLLVSNTDYLSDVNDLDLSLIPSGSGNIVAIEDFDNDFDYDLLIRKNDYKLILLLNDGEDNFSEMQEIDITSLGNPTSFIITDIDNNSLLDILITNSEMNDVVGLYQDNPLEFNNTILREYSTNGYSPEFLIDLDNDGDLDLEEWRNNTNITNEKPAYPTNVTAVQTENTLLIKWDNAVDAETPAAQMRYNLSVKKADATGANSYIISPDNEGNENAAYLPSKQYIKATQFEIPISRFEDGNYEIQLQSLDLWNALSPFSPVLTISVTSDPKFDITDQVCFQSETTLTYTGTSSSDLTWDFDDATVVSGSDAEGYVLSWNTSGVKTISVTDNGVSYSKCIEVLPDIDATITLSDELVAGVEEEIVLADNSKINPEITITSNDENASIRTEDGFYYITPSVDGKLEITVAYTTDCNTKTGSTTVTVLPAQPQPEISLVTVNGNGKYELSWDNSNWLERTSLVNIYKETSIYNHFELISEVAKSVTSFEDVNSIPQQQSERYYIEVVDDKGRLSEPSEIHKSLHLTINTGANNTWNLIWNNYQGQVIGTYNVLRGSSADDLTIIAELAGSNTSYTDLSPLEGDNYYSVQMIPATDDLKSAQEDESTIASNVVCSSDAISAILATGIWITPAEDELELNLDQTTQQLSAIIIPANTTIRDVKWEITEGSELASISEDGLLTHALNGAGSLTVRATTLDGSSLSTEATINVSNTKYCDVTFVVKLSDTQYANGAEVTLNGTTATTSSDGLVTFSDISGGTYSYSVTYSNKSYDGEIVLDGDDVTEEVSLQGHSVTFVVSYDDGGFALSTIVLNDQSEVSPSANGTATFSDIANGTYSFTVTAYGTDAYEVYEGTVVVNGEDVEQQVVLARITSDISIVVKVSDTAFADGASVYLDSPFGSPYGDQEATTSADGSVNFSHLLDGTYDYTVSYDGYATYSGQISITGNVLRQVMLTKASGNVSFMVKLADTEYANAAEITLDGQTATTSADGTVTFSDIANGTYTFSVTYNGYDTYTGQVVVEGNDVDRQVLLGQVTSNVIFIVKNSDGQLIDNAQVTFNGATGTTTSSGSVWFYSITNGTYSFSVVYDGYIEFDGEIEVAGNDIVENVALVSTGVEQVKESTMLIYPNPAKTTVTIKDTNRHDIYIYNISGRMVKHISNTENDVDINISDLHQGIYSVKVGNQVTKLIIKH